MTTLTWGQCTGCKKSAYLRASGKYKYHCEVCQKDMQKEARGTELKRREAEKEHWDKIGNLFEH